MKYLIPTISSLILGFQFAQAGIDPAAVDVGADDSKVFEDKFTVEDIAASATEAGIGETRCDGSGFRSSIQESLNGLAEIADAETLKKAHKVERLAYYEVEKLSPSPIEEDLRDARTNQVMFFSLRHQAQLGNGTRVLNEDIIIAPKHVFYRSDMKRRARMDEFLACVGDDFTPVEAQLRNGSLSSCYSIDTIYRYGSLEVIEDREDLAVVRLKEPMRFREGPAGIKIAGNQHLQEEVLVFSLGADSKLHKDGLIRGVQVCKKYPAQKWDPERLSKSVQESDCVGHRGYSGGPAFDFDKRGRLERDTRGRIVFSGMLISQKGPATGADDLYVPGKIYRRILAVDSKKAKFIWDASQNNIK